MNGTIWAAAAAAGVIMALAACSGQPNAPLPNEGVIALSDQFTGDFALVDKTGAPARDEDFEGRVMLVYFGYTHCPDVCPGDINVMSAALNELGDKAGEIAPVFISVDPERDTPEALEKYFAFDERLIPLTGSAEAAAAARASFKVVASKEILPDSALGYTVNHMRFFFVTDRQGQPQYALRGGASPEETAVLLRRVMKGS